MASYTVKIPGWRPATVNELMHSVRQRVRLKKRDREFVAAYVRVRARVPLAAGPRRVSLILHYGPGERRADPDAHWKSLLDALSYNDLLVDDGPAWCETGPVEYDPSRDPDAVGTTVTIEDIPREARGRA